jgi:hypothetical protein
VQKLLYILLFLSLSNTVLGQQSKHTVLQLDTTKIEVKHFDLKHFQKYKDNADFNYEVIKQEPNFLMRVYMWLGRVFKIFLVWLFGTQKAGGIILTFFRILPYVILAATLYFMAKFFIKINANHLTKGQIAKKGKVKILDDEALMQTEDLDALLNKAIAQANYRLAIRFEYLKILRQLSLFELIDWQAQKTNLDYYNEINNAQLKPVFKESTLLYDYVWYGNFNIDKGHYSKLKTILDNLLNSINQFGKQK